MLSKTEELGLVGWRWTPPSGVGFSLPPEGALKTEDGEVVSGIYFFGDRRGDVARVLVAARIPKEGEENRYYRDGDKLRFKVVETYELRVGDEVVVGWLKRAGHPETVVLRAGERWE